MKDSMTHVIERYFGELFNQGKVELVPVLLHPAYVNHSRPPQLAQGREGVGIVVLALRAAFPDLLYTIDDMVIGQDRVAVRTRMSGTHLGDFFGHPATGRSFEVRQMTFERFEGGQIIEHYRLTDDASMARQLGLS